MATEAFTFADFVKSAIGPFVGAGLAFLAAKLHESAKLKRESLAAGRLALLTISSQLNDFLVYRTQTRLAFAARAVAGTNPPAWWFAHPAVFHFDPALTIDFKALSFLDEGRNYTDMYGAVRLAEVTYFDLKARNDDMHIAALQVQRLLAEKFGAATEVGINDAAAALGPQLTAQAGDLARAIARRCGKSDELRYFDAFNLLRDEIRAEYGDVKLPKLGAVPPKHSLETLPPLPTALGEPAATATAPVPVH